MKFIVQILAIALLGGILQYYFPWWTMAIAAFVVGFLFASSGWRSFFAGLLGVGLLWLIIAIYVDQQTNSILSTRVAGLFPTKNVPLLMLLTALVGGLVGGFASLTGSVLTYRRRHRW